MTVPQVSQAQGYFHWPPVWVLEKSRDQEIKTLNEVVFETTMPSGLQVKILRKGIFIFDFSKSIFGYLAPNIDFLTNENVIKIAMHERINILNIHLVCLYSTYALHEHQGFSKMVITPSNTISYPSLNNIEHLGLNFDSDVLAKIEFMQSANSKYLDRKTRSIVISKEVIIQSLEMLEQVLQHPQKDAKDLISLYARSCKAYEDQEFGLSLSTAWTITEKLLFVFWNGYIDYLIGKKPKQIQIIKTKYNNGKKTNPKEYFAGKVIEILRKENKLPDSLADRLDEIRDNRNDWLHSLKPISNNDASDAIFLAGDMLRLIYEIEFRIPLSISMVF